MLRHLPRARNFPSKGLRVYILRLGVLRIPGASSTSHSSGEVRRRTSNQIARAPSRTRQVASWAARAPRCAPPPRRLSIAFSIRLPLYPHLSASCCPRVGINIAAKPISHCEDRPREPGRHPAARLANGPRGSITGESKCSNLPNPHPSPRLRAPQFANELRAPPHERAERHVRVVPEYATNTVTSRIGGTLSEASRSPLQRIPVRCEVDRRVSKPGARNISRPRIPHRPRRVALK